MSVALVGGATALGLVIASSSSSATGTHPSAVATSVDSPASVPVAAIRIVPAPGSINLPLNTIVSVATPLGILKSVAVTPTGGTPVTGAVANGNQEWQSQAGLSPSTDYHVTAVVTGPDGKTVTKTSTFTTMTPTETLGLTMSPNQKTVGVGEPITIIFDHPVVNQAAVEAALHVSMTQPVPGGWHWFSSTELHFRPTNYWPAGEQVQLDADLTGVDAGNGIWGVANHSISFSVGDSHVATANLATHEMTVTDNGQVVQTYPISGGSDVYPTMNGIHLVLDKEPVVHMVSSTVGIPVDSPNGYDELVYWDTHISDSGEYVHAAPWSVGAQGSTNVSHGCINLSVDRAEWFYNFSQVGDVVNVIGSIRPPVVTDGALLDWQEADWTPAPITTLPASAATATTSTTVAGNAASVAPTTATPAPTTAAPPPTLPPATTAAPTVPVTAAPTTATTVAPPATSSATPTTAVP